MFGLTRWNSFDDVFNFQREVDRLFNQFWSDLPTRTAAGSSPSFHVTRPRTAGALTYRCQASIRRTYPSRSPATISPFARRVRARATTRTSRATSRRLMIPQFLDLEKLTASHRHGMLRLTLPLKESVKPRRVQIEIQAEDQKQLAGVR